MAKKPKVSEEEDFFKTMASDTGGEVLADTGNDRYYIDSGNLALNYINSGKFFGGGFAGGKIIEAYGPPSSSKSLLANCFLAGCQRLAGGKGIAIYLDAERATNKTFAISAGHVDASRLLVYYPESIEKVESKIIAVTNKIRLKYGIEIPIAFVWDSISVSPCDRELRETELEENYTQADFKRIVGSKEKPGERAKAAGDALRKLCPFLDKNNATLFVINQIRQAIGVMYGSDEITAGGGKALPFYASTRLRCAANKHFTDKNEMPIGANLKYTNKKSRSCAPHMFVENVQLFFKHGVNPLGGLLTTLVIAGRIEAINGKNYKVLEPWAGGKEVVFKGTKTDNTVPSSVLLDCPSLVDADSSEQVADYLAIFKDAIDLVEGGKLGEKAITDEGDVSGLVGLTEETE